MRLTDHLEQRHVLLDMRASGMEAAIAVLTDQLRELGSVRDADAVGRALVEREEAHTTSLGNGVALPHATLPEVERPLLLVAVAPDGIDFAPDDAEPVRLFFLLVSPTHQAGAHIKLLARIVRLVRRPGFVTSLIEAPDGAALVAEIERVDALHV